MSDNFNLYSQYYDLLYEDKNYEREVEYIHHLIQNHTSGNKQNLLDLGSGTGKHGKLFADKGYTVLGLERSAEMVAVANKEKHKNFSSIQGDIIDFYLNKRFDVVTALFHVLSYVNKNSALELVFKNVYLHLKRGGYLFLMCGFPQQFLHKNQRHE